MQRPVLFGLKKVVSALLNSGLASLALLLPIKADAITPGIDTPICGSPMTGQVITSPLLSVLTLNMAHGRKDGVNQMLQKTSTTRKNLQEIADFLSASGADLIALQEADSPSRWSGKFNHVEFVSQKSPFPCRLHAHHASNYMYDFGTALLSRVPFTESLLHTFAPSPPTTNKGFVLGKVNWNPAGRLSEPIEVSVISVHLDFSRKKVRQAQIEEMRELLSNVVPPIIILGDFNTDWTTDDSALKTIIEQGSFKVYQPESTQLGTYKKGKHRLDWILISKDLEFDSYHVSQVVLSDHQAVQASLKLIEKPSPELDSNDDG